MSRVDDAVKAINEGIAEMFKDDPFEQIKRERGLLGKVSNKWNNVAQFVQKDGAR